MSDRHLADNPALARLIEKQMRTWELTRSQGPRSSGEDEVGISEFVTVANIVGAGGNEVAQLLGEKLGWSVFDRQILTTMAGDDEVRGRLYRSMDERDLGWFEDTFRSLMQDEFHKNDYFHRLSETILVLARQGPAVFVGRAADLILPRRHGLRVKLIASIEHCAANFAKRNSMSVDQARAEVNRIEAERRAFVEHHFHIDAYDPTRFDLLVNVQRFRPRQTAELILAALRARDILS